MIAATPTAAGFRGRPRINAAAMAPASRGVRRQFAVAASVARATLADPTPLRQPSSRHRRRPAVAASAALVPPDYGFVMGSLASTAALLQFLAIRVALARRLFDVPYPQMYIGDGSERGRVFDCTQRSHQNTLETAPAQMVMIALLGVAHPIPAAAAQAVWVAGRVAYGLGYSTGDPQARLPGVAISGLIYVLTILACTVEGARMVLSG